MAAFWHWKIWERISLHKIIITTQTYIKKSYVALHLKEDAAVDLEIAPLEETLTESIGTICIGKIKDIQPKLHGMFVDIQKGQTCYMDLRSLPDTWFVKRARAEQITQGDELVVQIKRERTGSKFPIVSGQLEFAGSYLVLTNEAQGVGYSKKLSAEAKKRLQSLPFVSDFEGSLIFRTNAESATDEELTKEFAQLSACYRKLKSEFKYRTCYSILKEPELFFMSMLFHIRLEELEQVLVDQPELYQKMQEKIQDMPKMLEKLSFYDKKTENSYGLNVRYNINSLIQQALQERVWLKSGAYLIIQPTEAMTVIDVNSGKNEGKKKQKDYFLRINLEAATEIARQLRLRNISGICIVDFINLTSKEEQQQLLSYMSRLLQDDTVNAQAIDITSLGLMEITRKKQKKSLWEQLEYCSRTAQE